MNHISASEALEEAGFQWAGTTVETMAICGQRWVVYVRNYFIRSITCRVLIAPSCASELLHGNELQEIRENNRRSVENALCDSAICHVMEVCA